MTASIYYQVLSLLQTWSGPWAEERKVSRQGRPLLPRSPPLHLSALARTEACQGGVGQFGAPSSRASCTEFWPHEAGAGWSTLKRLSLVFPLVWPRLSRELPHLLPQLCGDPLRVSSREGVVPLLYCQSKTLWLLENRVQNIIYTSNTFIIKYYFI